MGYGDSTRKPWVDAAIAYVDAGDDAPLRALLARYREQDARENAIASLQARARHDVIKRAHILAGVRMPTGWTAKSVGVRPPEGVNPNRAGRVNATEADQEWVATHTRNPRDRWGAWFPDDKVCDDTSCSLVGKWMMPRLYGKEGDPEQAAYCEKHSKEVAIALAIRDVRPEYVAEYEALGIGWSVSQWDFRHVDITDEGWLSD